MQLHGTSKMQMSEHEVDLQRVAAAQAAPQPLRHIAPTPDYAMPPTLNPPAYTGYAKSYSSTAMPTQVMEQQLPVINYQPQARMASKDTQGNYNVYAAQQNYQYWNTAEGQAQYSNWS